MYYRRLGSMQLVFRNAVGIRVRQPISKLGHRNLSLDCHTLGISRDVKCTFCTLSYSSRLPDNIGTEFLHLV